MKRFKNILCAVEPREECQPVLERAVALAENNQASLTVIDVTERVTAGIGMPEGGPISADLQDAVVSEHAQWLETLVEPYRKRLKIQTKVLVGIHFLEIIREVLSHKHDLLIKIPENQDWLNRFFGSDDMHLLRKCPCPVWLIKPTVEKPYRRILAAVDVDDADSPSGLESRHILNQQILEMASSLALSDFAELHIAFAWHPVTESAMRSVRISSSKEPKAPFVDQEQERRRYVASLNVLMNEVTSDLERDALDYLKPQAHLLEGRARKEIPVVAMRIDADLVVMGTVVRTGIPGFIMGNTAETILNQIDCSVLAIKPPGFKTPVTQE